MALAQELFGGYRSGLEDTCMVCISLLYMNMREVRSFVLFLVAGGGLVLLGGNPVAPKLCLSNTFHLMSLVIGVR